MATGELLCCQDSPDVAGDWSRIRCDSPGSVGWPDDALGFRHTPQLPCWVTWVWQRMRRRLKLRCTSSAAVLGNRQRKWLLERHVLWHLIKLQRLLIIVYLSIPGHIARECVVVPGYCYRIPIMIMRVTGNKCDPSLTVSITRLKKKVMTDTDP